MGWRRNLLQRGGPAYYPGNVYSNNVYRGYGHYDEPGRKGVSGAMLPVTRLGPQAVGVDPVWEGSRQRALDIRAGDTAVAKHTVVLMVEVANVGTNRGWRGISMLQLLLQLQLPDDGRRSAIGWLALVALCAGLVLGLGDGQMATAQESGQKTFNSAAEAADAFAAAVQNHDEAAMQAILGPSGQT